MVTDTLDRELAQLQAHGPDLRGAIVRGEIETVYQPQFALPGEALVGAEALARWAHPAIGTVGAQALFAIAEEQHAGLVLSERIVDTALRAARRWPPAMRLSVNLLPQEVEVDGFAEALLARITRCGADPARITVEITEEVLLGDLPGAARTLTVLREAGLAIALDDFGAGFCNFGYLKALPLDYLKLDRSMVDGIATDERDLAVFRGIVAMADALGLGVIAEGIERDEQRAVAAREGCVIYQGFLRAAPMDGAAFERLALAQAAF